MVRGFACAVLAATVVVMAGAASAQFHRSPNRPEIVEVGDPILITRKVLGMEMRRNSDLRDWVRLYGAPDYAEVQEIEIDPPFAPYEVRIYYLKGNAYLAFGRVHVAPSLYDYGVHKFFGHITAADMDRLLTAQPATYDEVRVTETAAMATVPPPFIIETLAVEGKPVAE